MVSNEDYRSGNQSVNCQNSGDHHNTMMNQGLREMSLNVYDFDDWVVISKDTDIRASKGPRVGPNPAHSACGQPALLRKPRIYDQVSWNNFHTPSGGFVWRPPNVINNSHSGMLMGKLGSPPRLRSGFGVNGLGCCKGTYDGMQSEKCGCGVTVITIDTDSSDDEAEGGYSGGRSAKDATSSKARAKGAQGAHRGVVPKAYNSRFNASSNVLHPGFGNSGWTIAGQGLITQLAKHHPTPPSSCGGKFEKNGKGVSKVDCFDDGFTSEDDGDFPDEVAGDFHEEVDGDFPDEVDDWENDMKQSNWSCQSRQVGEDPLLGINGNVPYQGRVPYLYPNHTWKWASEVISSQAEVARREDKREVYNNTSNTNGTSHGFSKKCAVLKKYVQNSYGREGSLGKVSAKNGGQKGELLLEAESSDFDDEVENEVEVNCTLRQTSQFKEVFKEKKQYGKHQIKEESSEAIDVCADKQPQKERKKVAEQSTEDTLDSECRKDMMKRNKIRIARECMAKICEVSKQMKIRHQEFMKKKSCIDNIIL